MLTKQKLTGQGRGSAGGGGLKPFASEDADGDKGHCACRPWGEELKLQPRLRDVQILER